MRAVIQKTVGAKVDVVSENGTETCGKIDGGFVVLLGVTHSDIEKDARYVADKIAHLRVFEDEAGKLNLSLKDVGGSVLLVSQFTLYADAASGRRPSFSQAAPAEQAQQLYLRTAELLRGHGIHVETGRFRTHMQVSLCNDGPVTILLDSFMTRISPKMKVVPD
ncbi:TPA: D-tyrosyl-tRNA(Tyr) deacylase [Neisseria meningitidis]|uniref:D-aminoacyl-tRNA deacylase n=1 Tax=Neisseria meningitidis TaxID=487 RepID=UPI0001FBFB90|nr:D-aminoacyl-tRNA deacylase [Neisseria meningitidis]ARC12179.1 D-tyrosyl-tRNA(Tyr) deacylase [Neisseria meningitidis]EGC57560.1 D-tyrosyl-tRNA(Tyr) deacylase [Neisseria meningitidis M13399]EJU79850.1 D-tyrosyl-tRNA(Tyr) deacylase [Neisseria meningitidis NM3001]MBG9088298.1 D-tyrosyl-tRNA(Tyr) deacylase [Neisseria meningitidis]MCV6683762.1 D-aminoacyl-tRNA deacylase [Neisseria meningitidis]